LAFYVILTILLILTVFVILGISIGFHLFSTICSYSLTILAVWKPNLYKNVFLDFKTEDKQIFEKGKRQRSLFLV